MNKFALALFVLLTALPGAAATETWKKVSIVDSNCAAKVKDDPDEHTTKCALQCEKSGYGILTADGSFIKFDHSGNQKVVAALNATKKTDHLRATVVGEKTENQINLQSLTLD
ncbi:MAG: hypothetical protein HYX75_00125 [Acidobacteria bacterium]|nr:hypothetical protein [Acidobacteriota bacterium]